MDITTPSAKREFIGTFIKASGQMRTMRFVSSEKNIQSGGLITVYDVENRGLRKFNLATLVGRLTAINSGASVSFCA